MSIYINAPMLGAILVPNIGGYVGGVLTRRNLKQWYENLKKPKYLPPNWVFGPIWTTLYTGMGCASYLIYKDGGGFEGPAKYPLILYGVNLVANWIWTPIFFQTKQLTVAFYELQFVQLTAIATGYMFYKINPLAGLPYIPYVTWIGIASYYNYVFARDNPSPSKKIKEIGEKKN